MVPLFLVVTAGLALIPLHAYAWGPIAHLDYAQECLLHLSTFTPAVKALLSEYPFDFIYGALAADITLGKDYVDYVYNCHNWRVGFLILHEAKDRRQRACAYGYLSHLAVDIISHNFFVPYKTIRSYSARSIGHVYWEMRFDAKRPKRVWDLAKKISKMHFPHNDALFERMLERTLFSFKTNRRIFKSVLTLHRLGQWRKIMGKVHEISRFKLHDRDIEEYRRLAIDSAVKFLRDPEKAACTKVDPTGVDRLLYAKEMRHELRRLTQRGVITQEQAAGFLVKVKVALRGAIYRPPGEGELPTVGDLL